MIMMSIHDSTVSLVFHVVVHHTLHVYFANLSE